MSPPASATHAWLRALLWLWLGIWIGAMSLFGALTQVVFEVVPNPDMASHLVSRLLNPLLAAGGVSGVALAALGAALRRGPVAIAIPLLLSITCIYNQFGVSREVAEIRLANPGVDPTIPARFASLHHLSVTLFMAALLGAIALAVIHAWIEARMARVTTPSAAKRA